ncbi:unnamed protein product [Anisakis simplex]|uniref:Activin_recp domain-containing protein n=1 Tax=Anisakis simplex TaxID=6269 RepID=A0A0M3J3Y7_ANISI|nr:unnamed protein product [Anisakis simplex]
MSCSEQLQYANIQHKCPFTHCEAILSGHFYGTVHNWRSALPILHFDYQNFKHTNEFLIKGFKLIRGQSFGTETEECDNQSAYCYNMTVNAAVIINVAKAGCSYYRCMFARNTCRSTSFQGIPASFCCCDEDLCNVAINVYAISHSDREQIRSVF